MIYIFRYPRTMCWIEENTYKDNIQINHTSIKGAQDRFQ